MKGRKLLSYLSSIGGIGKAGNPLLMDQVDLVIGASTEVVAAEGMIVTAGGGYIAGDIYVKQIQLEQEAEVLLTTQSSTKIYKSPESPVIQRIEFDLKKGSVLEYLPDPVIAYPSARYKQSMTVRMESGASFVCTDIFTPGWAPDGSWFRYDLIQSRMKVYMVEKLVLFDHVRLEPDNEIQQLGSMEGFTHLGSMLMIHEGINEEFVDELYDLETLHSEVRIGLSLLSVPGVSIRVMASRTQDIEEVFGGLQSIDT